MFRAQLCGLMYVIDSVKKERSLTVAASVSVYSEFLCEIVRCSVVVNQTLLVQLLFTDSVEYSTIFLLSV